MLKTIVAVCQLGYYGNGCTGICSENCFQSRICDRFTGDCNVGCTQGWMGRKCDQRKTMFFFKALYIPYIVKVIQLI